MVRAPQGAPRDSRRLTPGPYTVESGDTLSTIADYPNIDGGWQGLADATADTIADPDLVFGGQVLQLPA
jgi:nucleoid-associated protein YgaU